MKSTNKTHKINIVIADDHLILAEGIAALLLKRTDVATVKVVADGEEAYLYAKNHQPDVVIMDVNMPGINGIEAAKRIKTRMPQIKVVMLSMHDRDGYIQHAIKAGVDGYLLKSANQQEINDAIDRVMDGRKYFSHDVAELLINKMTNAHEPEKGGIKLTDIEQKVLDLIANGHTTDEIGADLDLSSNTVQSYRKNLFIKFDAKNVSHLVKKAMLLGFIITDEDNQQFD
jgi:two-component system, NarL family, nitrate/nitrite response regulator NarL